MTNTVPGPVATSGPYGALFVPSASHPEGRGLTDLWELMRAVAGSGPTSEIETTNGMFSWNCQQLSYKAPPARPASFWVAVMDESESIDIMKMLV